MNNLLEIPMYLWFVLAVVLFTQASWIFLDASKRGENKWLWGLFGLLNTPGNLIIYLIVTRLVQKHQPCKICGKNIRRNYLYCPYCGERHKND
jgi:hypothetical protein